MKKIILTFLLLGMTACGGMESFSLPFVDNELAAFTDKFEIEANLRGVEIDKTIRLEIMFDSSLDGLAGPGLSINGQCRVYRDGKREVVINPSQWAKMNIQEKEQLMFHELAHCYLDMEHRDGWIESPLVGQEGYSTPLSLMHWLAFDSSYYELNYGYYLDELFLVDVDLSDYQVSPQIFDYAYYENYQPETTVAVAQVSMKTKTYSSKSKVEKEKDYHVACDH